jgi:phage terminase small subunit
VDAYHANGGNGKDAAIKAGYSPAAAEQQASNMLATVKIREAVSARQKHVEDRTDVRKEHLVTKLAQIVYANLKDVVSWDGKTLKIKTFDDIPEEIHPAIEMIRVKPDGTMEIKLVAKTPAIEELNRMLGFHAPTKVDATIHPPSTIIVEMPPERVKAAQEREQTRLQVPAAKPEGNDG